MSNRQVYNNHNLDFRSANIPYFFHQNGGNFLLQQQHHQQHQQQQHQQQDHKFTCNCISLRNCNPIMEMAQKMFYGFIRDYLNSQLKVYQCNFDSNEMHVCCPTNNYHGYQQQSNSNQDNKWTFDNSEEDDEDSEDRANFKQLRPPPNYYGINQYVSYPIHSFLPFTKNKKLKTFHPKYQDHKTNKNCPTPFSEEFTLPPNHRFFQSKSQETTTSTTTTTTTTTTLAPPPLTTPSELPSKLALINRENCGQSSNMRIIGGEDAGVGRFMWIARLAYRNKTSNTLSYRCAGSLIADRYILTAAHCVTNLIDSLEL